MKDPKNDEKSKTYESFKGALASTLRALSGKKNIDVGFSAAVAGSVIVAYIIAKPE
jgi:hypothetical protein